MNLTHVLGWTLLHFFWQGAAIAILLAAALTVLRHASPKMRYAASCAAMLLMLVSASATFLQLEFAASPLPHAAAAAATVHLSGAAPAATRLPSPDVLADYFPAMIWAWFGGVLALSLRSLGGWAVAERFARRHTWPAEAHWEARFAALAKRLSITRPVRLAVSALAQVPAVVGWMRPVVLVPAGIFAGLTAEQVEALLAHELAHVCRRDYLVNLVQTAVETLFFYHPAVWWVGRTIRNERENCCDDVAVEVCGSAVAYARALTELEQIRHRTPRFAMAADGGSLLGRVQRLLRGNQTAGAAPPGFAAGIAIVCLLAAGIAGTGLAQRQGKEAKVTAEPRQDAGVLLKESFHVAQFSQPPSRTAPKTSQTAPKAAGEKKESQGWLTEIQAEGYRDLDVDQLIALKIHGVDGEFIRQIRAAGLHLTADELVAFRIHGVDGDFINQLKQAGLRNLTPDQLVALKIHDAGPAFVREIQSLGFANLSVDDVVALRIQGVTPDFIREVAKHFKNLTLDKIIQLKQFGILD